MALAAYAPPARNLAFLRVAGSEATGPSRSDATRHAGSVQPLNRTSLNLEQRGLSTSHFQRLPIMKCSGREQDTRIWNKVRQFQPSQLDCLVAELNVKP